MLEKLNLQLLDAAYFGVVELNNILFISLNQFNAYFLPTDVYLLKTRPRGPQSTIFGQKNGENSGFHSRANIFLI